MTLDELYNEKKVELARLRLAQGGELEQMEAIANHYARHAHAAIEVSNLLKTMRSRHLENDPTYLEVARYLTNQVKESHAIDLGIELKWEDDDNDRYYSY
jgi:hypothetical protein